MKDQRLVELNFKDLLHYGGQPLVQNEYDPPLQCTGYCVDCDRKYKVSLDLMSHGCDTSDFEQLLGMLPVTDYPPVTNPVLFLLEDPGSPKYRNGEPTTYLGFTKVPPVNHYYWTPPGTKWGAKLNQRLNREKPTD